MPTSPIFVNFKMCQYSGVIPFTLRNGQFTFSWKSFQVFYFLLVTAYSTSVWIYHMHMLITEIRRSVTTHANSKLRTMEPNIFRSNGILNGLFLVGWCSASSCLVTSLLIIFWNRQKIMDYFNFYQCHDNILVEQKNIDIWHKVRQCHVATSVQNPKILCSKNGGSFHSGSRPSCSLPRFQWGLTTIYNRCIRDTFRITYTRTLFTHWGRAGPFWARQLPTTPTSPCSVEWLPQSPT